MNNSGKKKVKGSTERENWKEEEQFDQRLRGRRVRKKFIVSYMKRWRWRMNHCAIFEIDTPASAVFVVLLLAGD